jgi:23S rRNA (uracil1939-C5)-methyltransferase
MGNGRLSRPDGTAEVGTVAALTHEGEGIVRAGRTVFVSGALPGERIRFQRIKRRRQYDQGRLLEILEPASDRVAPRCAHFGVCGGCALQHLSSASQLTAKQAELREGLERIARVAPDEWLPPLSGPQWGYRRRARLGAKYVVKKGRVVIGFRERLAPYIAALERCEVLAPPADRIITPLSELLNSLDIRERVPQIEVAAADNALALVLRVLDEPTDNDLAKLRDFESSERVRLYLQRGGLDTVARLAPTADEAALHYTLPQFQLTLEFGPTDFVQINSVVNAALVGRAIDLLRLTPQSRVLDLFCGLGNFTLPLARRAAHVVGVEGDAKLIDRARHNAQRNALSNVELHVSDLAADPPGEAVWRRQAYTHVLLDPPRAGAREMLPTLAQFGPERVLYISCHPGSLARDIGLLVHDHGFMLRAAGVVDMFPHTAHVESIAVLEPRRS